MQWYVICPILSIKVKRNAQVEYLIMQKTMKMNTTFKYQLMKIRIYKKYFVRNVLLTILILNENFGLISSDMAVLYTFFLKGLML